MKFGSCQMPEFSIPVLRDANRTHLTLTPIGDGGEARVYSCPQRPGAVVKVYRPEQIANGKKFEATVARLNALVTKYRLVQSPAFAWPDEPVYDTNGRLAGFVMKKIPDGYVRFSSLFGGVKSVRRAFPSWTRRDLAKVAFNFVNLIGLLKRNGVMPCDFNPDNFLVNDEHQIFCIDCDSYQVDDGRMVHVAESFFYNMAAPEVVTGHHPNGSPRTEAQLNWSCAVMVFRLLMCGMHPFQYADVASDGTQAGSVEENLKAGKCPLGFGSGCRFGPQWAPLWSWLTGKMKDVFVTTFRKEPGHGWGEPNCRAPLEVQANELKRLLYEMDRSPERTMFCPPIMKAREYVQARPAFAAYQKTAGMMPRPRAQFTAYRSTAPFPKYNH